LGRAAAHFKKYDINETIAVCEGMPDGKKSILCRAGGFLNIFDHTDDRQFSIKICDEGLETADRLACRREANLFGTAF
jgi:hypothetical protein